ncbi:molybdate transport system substrate-binding protein [Caldalkalibacillus uzonensis]|uniref:Molybdate transport system substrate-binding protein n=1 Tax=Caldalkalibacillus uzonensis TaxID=353224 RepID=A0ABU0CXW2_9BACI|nr:molybdate ABC transporter substrate-binding protein [Caldalkalibacillus uzonensis]MDQ0340978.1 molybdate transport system substrate-binding protein [Caldalkalibacillus uzonensis]
MHKLIILFMLILLIGCDNENMHKEEMTVAAAADLYHAFTEIGEAFTEQTGIDVTFTFGSTGNLSQQISQGAPFDLFAAAHESYVDDLIDKVVVAADTKAYYALGRIGFLTPRGQFTQITSETLLDPSVQTIAIANPEHAPYGQAAKEAFMTMGIWEAIQEKLVFGDNIRQTHQFVETGNADIGVVALALVIDSQLDFFLIDDDLHEPILQALAIPVHTNKMEQAQKFSDFVLGQEGREILVQYGFELPGE